MLKRDEFDGITPDCEYKVLKEYMEKNPHKVIPCKYIHKHSCIKYLLIDGFKGAMEFY